MTEQEISKKSHVEKVDFSPANAHGATEKFQQAAYEGPQSPEVQQNLEVQRQQELVEKNTRMIAQLQEQANRIASFAMDSAQNLPKEWQLQLASNISELAGGKQDLVHNAYLEQFSSRQV